jgi:hypothetical protein
MVEQGKTVKDVLRLQIPDFDKLDTYGCYLAEKGLRAAIARRRKQATTGDSECNPGRFPAARNPTKLHG